MAQFEINESLPILNRGLAIIGNILTGELKSTDLIDFVHDNKSHTLEIKEVNFVSSKNNAGQIGLLFVYENDLQKEYYSNLKIAPQIVTITNQ